MTFARLIFFALTALFWRSSAVVAQEDVLHQHHHSSGDDESSVMPKMNREGSGTSWQPDTSPVSMIMVDAGDLQFMFHSNFFLGVDVQSSRRGDSAFFSSNWAMGSVTHALGTGQISGMLMLSLEPFTVPSNGYPLLFQSGETWQGEHIHDRQHPHDFFMEIAAKYAFPVSDRIGLEFYTAVAGEPALGPTAFPHRTSSQSNPFAPIGHHWYDSTHISFGVLTMGVFGQKWKLEGSWFNGTEPDENRFNIDLRVPDSYSSRLSYNPFDMMSMQASYGFLKNPEGHEPKTSVHRLTTSISLNFSPWSESNLASTVMFGANIASGGKATAFGLAEINFDLTKHHTVFGRLEAGSKTGEELVLPNSVADTAFGIGALSLGYTFRFPTDWQVTPAIGAVGTINRVDSHLAAYYGDKTQLGAMIFLQLRI